MRFVEHSKLTFQHLPYDYELLENLGDSFLKILITLHIFALHPTFHEGRLTKIRVGLENNRALTKRVVKTGLLGAILCEPLTRALWSPLIRNAVSEEDIEAQYALVDAEAADEDLEEFIENDTSLSRYQNSFQKSVISDKTIADTLEALMGVGLLHKGIQGGSLIAKLFLKDEYEIDWIKDYGKLLRKAGYFDFEKESYIWYRHAYEKVENAIGYTFIHKNLIVEALTHPSAVTEGGNCYQRLELLGLR